MPRIRVLSKAGLFHAFSGFKAWEPGVYDFPDDQRYAGFLQGHIERGTCRLAWDEPEDSEKPADPSKLTNAQLRDLLTQRGIETTDRATKAELLTALAAASEGS